MPVRVTSKPEVCMSNDNGNDIKATLQQLKDEMKLKLKLGAMESGEMLADIDAAMDKAEAKLKGAASAAGDKSQSLADKLRLEATLAMGELKTKWPAVENAWDGVVQDAKRMTDELKTDADSMRVQANLAMKDADVKLDAAAATLKREAGELLDDVKGAVAAFKKKLSE
jgi:hypothetical protein